MLRGRDALEAEGDLPFRPLLEGATLELPPPRPGRYAVTFVETHNGQVLGESPRVVAGGPLRLELPPFRHDVAIAVRPAG